MDDQYDVFMRDSDAFSWYMEQDPILRSTVVAIAWLDRSPDWGVLASKIDRLTRLIPLFRKRPAEPPARIAPPRWMTDPEFDLSWHLRRVNSPAPHTPETVIELARVAAMTAFDRSRPLWELTLVEHLEGDRAALVMKLHHSLTDGVGGMELALYLFDRSADSVLQEAPESGAGDGQGPGGLLAESLAHDWQRLVDAARSELSGALPAAVHTLRHPVLQILGLVETARSIGRTVAPVSQTLSPVMSGRGLGRHLAMLSVDLGELKAAARTAGGSVNDGFLAGVTGGLRRYHERHRAPVGELRVTLPISIRTETDPIAGNRITLQRFKVPVGVTDPAERLRGIREQCRAARDERSLPFTDAIAGTLNLLPRGVVGSMLKHVDFVASDVPGFSFPVYLAGARMSGYFAFGPTIGASMNLTLLSYNETCCVGINMDVAAVPDPDTLVECLREGFEEVLTLAGPHRPVVLPLRDNVYPGEPSATVSGTPGPHRHPEGARRAPRPAMAGAPSPMVPPSSTRRRPRGGTRTQGRTS